MSDKEGNDKRNLYLIGGVLAALAAIGATYFYWSSKSGDLNSGTGKGTETTLAIIKPDGMQHAADIKKIIVESGFIIVQSRKINLTLEMAGLFYNEHKERDFYQNLIQYMSSGSVVVMKLEKENAIRAWRDLMGPTNPVDAKRDAPDSIRALYGTSLDANAVHGSDSPTAADREIDFFFDD